VAENGIPHKASGREEKNGKGIAGNLNLVAE